MIPSWVRVVYLLSVLYPTPVSGQTGAQAKSLYTQMFVTDSYNSRIRPANDQSQPTAVSISLNLIAINEVNIIQETLKTTAYLQIEWADDFLVWVPASYGGLTEYHWPQNDVWKPDIALANSFSDFDDLGSLALIIHNTYNGTMSWTPFEVFTSTCSINVNNFPFDTQTCKMEFVSWGYKPSQVTLTGGSAGFGLSEYEGNALWSIQSTNWYTVTDADDVTIVFEITIKRDPTYVLITVVLPVLLLSVLNLFVFVLPCDSGEKASYAITVFLAFAVFFSVISANLPETVAIVMVYAILMTISSTLTCLIVLVQVRCYGFDEAEHKVPAFLVFMSKLGACKVCFDRNEQRQNKVKTLDDTKRKPIGNSVQSVTDADTELANQKEDRNEPGALWKDVINGSDTFFIYFFTIYFVICTIILFAVVLS